MTMDVQKVLSEMLAKANPVPMNKPYIPVTLRGVKWVTRDELVKMRQTTPDEKAKP